MHTQKLVDVKQLGQFTPEGFAGANTDGSVKVCQTPQNMCLSRKGFLSEVFLSGDENGLVPGNLLVLMILCCFRDVNFGRRGRFCLAKWVFSEMFSLAGFRAKRVFSERGSLSCAPLPLPGSA